MQDVVPTIPRGRGDDGSVLERLMDYLPRGNTLDGRAWRRRHRLLEWVLLLHVPGLVGLGLLLRHPAATIAEVVLPPVVCLVVGHLVTHRRWASFFVTGGLVFCSAALVVLSRGSIEAHFHFFIIIGFIALYQDWVPFLWNVAFTVLSHGIGTIWLGGQIFNHPAAQQHPWLWSFIHGVAVLFACVGVVIFWRVTEDEQTEKETLGRRLLTADAEINRRQFTSDMLVNLARRNQSMLYRQLDIINQLEEKERDPDALADLFKLDHLATRVRRNAESLLVLAGEQTPRTWSAPVALRDVVRAAIAETEDLDRVVFAVDESAAVSGTAVADLTHLLAELTENAVRFSPPETAVTIRARPNRRDEGGQLLTVEDWGVGMPPQELAEANDMLAHPREVDLAVSQRLGFHVVSRLAARHGIAISLSATPGSGITAVAVLPAALFTAVRAAEPIAVGPDLPVAQQQNGSQQNGSLQNRSLQQGSLQNGSLQNGSLQNGSLQNGSLHGDPRPADAASPYVPGIAVIRNGDAWLPPEPFTAGPGADSGPAGPDGRWRGWWNPEVHGADGADLNSFTAAAADGGVTLNGTASNGSAPNGTAADGTAPNGSASYGTGSDDPGAGEVRAGAGQAARPGTLGMPWPPVTAPRVPEARRARPVPLDAGPPTSGVPTPPGGAVAPALPQPRSDEAAPAAGIRSGSNGSGSNGSGPNGPGSGGTGSNGTGGRGLRRRVPQSHLTPELRHPGQGGLADTAAPLSADAAATALSRYQASRLAAQAAVEGAGPTASSNEGERA